MREEDDKGTDSTTESDRFSSVHKAVGGESQQGSSGALRPVQVYEIHLNGVFLMLYL